MIADGPVSKADRGQKPDPWEAYGRVSCQSIDGGAGSFPINPH
jgi:hypothetical protein